jgi:flavin-dependent dehydrogenase
VADVLIAGGGIAGSSLAIMLGRAGATVALFEQGRFPREKACGEGIMPPGVAVLERLGLAGAVGGAPFEGVRYYADDIVAEGRFPRLDGRPATGRGQRRWHLDQVLFAAAAATPGVAAYTSARVEAPIVERGRVVGLRVLGEDQYAPLTIAADGAHSRLRRRLGLDSARPESRRAGLRAHFRLAPAAVQPPWVEVFLGQAAEVYVTPLPDREILVAALMAHEVLSGGAAGAFQRLIRAQPALRARLEGAEQITAFRGMSPLTTSARAGVVPGAALLGDAAGFVDPITGGGITQALLTAELLAEHLCRERPDGVAWLMAYDRARTALLRDYRRLTRLVLGLADHPRLARAALRLLGWTPGCFSHLLGAATGMRGLWPAPLASARAWRDAVVYSEPPR